jgi:hypothetical protein
MDETFVKINNLKERVNKFSGKKVEYFDLQNVKQYIIPILIVIPFILLIIFKPKFLYIENKEKTVFSYKKLLMYTLIFSTILVVGYYTYTRKIAEN